MQDLFKEKKVLTCFHLVFTLSCWRDRWAPNPALALAACHSTLHGAGLSFIMHHSTIIIYSMFWPSSKSHQMLSKCQYAICCFNVNSQKNTWENRKEFGKRLKTSLEKDFLPLPATALLRSDASEKPEASRYRIRWLGNLHWTKTIDDPNLQKAPKATWSLAKTWSFL